MVARHVEKFTDIKNGTSAYISFLVTQATGRVDSKGHDFVDITASDSTQSVNVKLWNTSLEESGIKPGNVLYGHIDSKEYRGATTYSLRTYAQDEENKPEDFLLSAPVPVEDMFSWVKQRVVSFPEPYRQVATALVIGRGEEYCRAAAGSSIHHAFIGGLLYHSYRMARSAELLATVYGLDRDLTVCGCLLHDIGKLDCLSTDWTGNAEYTLQGQLESHLLTGVRMVEDAARAAGVLDTEEIKMLVHIIASHHGTPELGTLHAPMTREAMMVHALDMMDMEQEIYDETLGSLQKGQVTMYDVNGLGHRLYRPKI